MLGYGPDRALGIAADPAPLATLSRHYVSDTFGAAQARVASRENRPLRVMLGLADGLLLVWPLVDVLFSAPR